MSEINWADKTCQNTTWITPEPILILVRNYFGGKIPLDPATEPTNPTNAKKFFTEETNGLIQKWNQPTFVNPPYGKEIQFWCKKIHEEASRKPARPIIALLPCGSGRPGTKYWQKHILQPHLNAICFVKGRINFLKTNGEVTKRNTYPSQIMGFNVIVNHFIESFESLGKILKVEIANS